jgi:type IV pilus assembly protein PilN
MKGQWIGINLSTEPFRRDRSMLVAAAATAALLVALLAVQATVILRERREASDNRDALAAVERQLEALNAESLRLGGELRKPVNMAAIERGGFFNQLLQRKGISWTRMYGDLEGVFPPNVRLVAVRPYLTVDNEVQLDMVVGASAPEPVIQLMQRLENSPLFGSTALLSSQPPSQNDPLYRYRVSVSYAQKL